MGQLAVARQDPPDVAPLVIPSRLYGREKELEALSVALTDIAAGSGLVLLLPGPSGAGKTVLSESLREPVRMRNGFFLTGKFNQFQQGVPLYAIRQALAQLGSQLQGFGATERDRWKHQILTAVGDLGGLITALAPEFEAFLGPQRAVPDIGVGEASHRFVGVLRSLLGVFCQAEHQVVLFLDDWQWADAASLHVLRQLQVGTSLRYLLVVASYRDNEVDAAHPFRNTIADLRRLAVPVRTLPVGDLSGSDVQALLADTLSPAIEDVAGLTAAVMVRTKGNPFFTRALLEFLHSGRALWFEPSSRAWRWNVASLDLPDVFDEVELFKRQLRLLPLSCQELLILGACLGHQFDLQSLALAAEESPAECLTRLQPALERALVRHVLDRPGKPAPREAPESGLFVFRHDRVQQAAHALIEPERLAELRLKVARLFVARLGPDDLSGRLLEVADHYNAGRALVRDAAEQLQLLQLNIAAAKQASSATAYRAALLMHRVCGDLLARAELAQFCWSHHHDLMAQFYKAWADSEFLEGDPATAKRCLSEAVDQARDPVERADALITSIAQNTMLARYPEAIAAGRQALGGLGIPLPESDYEAARDREIALVSKHRNGRSVETLLRSRPMSDPTVMMTVRVLIAMGPPCYRSDQRLWSVLVPTVVKLTMQHGPVPQVGYSHTAFGGLMGWVSNDYAVAREFGALATGLMTEVFPEPSDLSVFHLMMGSSLRHWFAPLSAASADYRRAWDEGLRSGNLQYSAYAFGHNMYCRFFQGTPLAVLTQESRHSLQFSRDRRNQWAIDLLEGGLRVCGDLTGEDPARQGREDRTEDDYLRSVGEHHNIQVICIYKVLRATSLLLLGDNDRALQLSDEAEPLIYTVGSQGLLPWAEHLFARLLIRTALFSRADVIRQAQWRPELDRILAQLRIWADHCPENFEHKYLLAEAELARIDGRRVSAMRLYDQAVDAAHAGNFVQWEGLANERAGMFWRESGHASIAHECWQRAYVCFDAWGATAKVQAMEGAYLAQLAEQLPGGSESGEPEATKEREWREGVLNRRLALLRRQAGEERQQSVQLARDATAAALLRATELLKMEVAQHRLADAAVRASEERFRAMFERHAAVKLVLDQSTGAILDANSAAATFYGWSVDELKRMRIGQIVTMSPEALTDALAKVASAEQTRFDVCHRLADGSIRDVEVFSNQIEIAGSPVLYSIVHDVSERRQATDALQRSIDEKTVLLREVHHRVKNNLQIVTSLIGLQARRIENPETVLALRDVESRILSMALLHEALYRSGDFAQVDFDSYAKELCAHLMLSFGAVADRVTLERRVTCTHLRLDQSVPCGLIINEAISNALKHAFPGDRKGRILVELLRQDEQQVSLRVSDDGAGLPADVDPAISPTLGLRLIVNLARQLNGECTLLGSEAGGTTVQVTFPFTEQDPGATA